MLCRDALGWGDRREEEAVRNGEGLADSSALQPNGQEAFQGVIKIPATSPSILEAHLRNPSATKKIKIKNETGRKMAARQQ